MTTSRVTISAIRETFAAHRGEIIGAARRAPRKTSIWAVVEADGTWRGICGPFQRGSYPAALHEDRGHSLYSLRLGGDPFLSRDRFDDSLFEAYMAWLAAEEEEALLGAWWEA